jgi:hypothetical protein
MHAYMKSWTRSQTQVPLILHTSVSFCVFYDDIQDICIVILGSSGDEKKNNQHSIHWNYKHAYLLFVFVSTFEFQ